MVTGHAVLEPSPAKLWHPRLYADGVSGGEAKEHSPHPTRRCQGCPKPRPVRARGGIADSSVHHSEAPGPGRVGVLVGP